MHLNVLSNFLGTDRFLYGKEEEPIFGVLGGVGTGDTVFVLRGLFLEDVLIADAQDSSEKIAQICDTLPGGVSVVGFFCVADGRDREHVCYDSLRMIGRNLQEMELSHVFLPSAKGYVFCWTSPMDSKSSKFEFVYFDSSECIEDVDEPLLTWMEAEEFARSFCTFRSTVSSSFGICIPRDHAADQDHYRPRLLPKPVLFRQENDREKEASGSTSFSWNLQSPVIFPPKFTAASITAEAHTTREVEIAYERLRQQFHPRRVLFLSKAMDLLASRELTERLGSAETADISATDLHRRLSNVCDGRKRVQESSQFYQHVDVQCFFDMSVPFDRGSGAVGIELSIDDFVHCRLPCTLSAIAMVPKEASILDIHSSLCSSLQRCISEHERAILKFSDLKTLSFADVEFLLFLPPPKSLYMSVCLPTSRTDEQLETERSLFHRVWNLPMDRCFFRRTCRFEFPKEGGLIRSIHTMVAPPATTGRVALVQGPYNYHHYMQDSFDDRGWGCAYRSLQTIWSWYVLNGYTSVPVPTHREIQQALVDVRDQPPSFVGAKKWIGSLELSYVLSHVLKIDSKILNAKSSSEIDHNADELACHFNGEGTPVMIGGGVLAHVILGVFVEASSNVVKYLVLDPHYTGAEDVKSIIQKGWCGWKPSTFWAKGSFYNLLLPSRPRTF